jgi:hypothetical protein
VHVQQPGVHLATTNSAHLHTLNAELSQMRAVPAGATELRELGTADLLS